MELNLLKNHPYKGRYVIVRSDRAGVFSGYLQDYDIANQTAFLTESRRLWKWLGFTLSAVAQNGMIISDEANIAITCPEIMIQTVIELIPCSEKAELSLKEYPVHITPLDVKE